MKSFRAFDEVIHDKLESVGERERRINLRKKYTRSVNQ